jgi:ParB family chromosome partitioning protein
MTTTLVLSPPELRALRPHRYAGLFPQLVGSDRDELRDSMRRRGYDEAFPLVVWEQTGELIDGHNRRDVALELGFVEVPVVLRDDFESEADVAAFIVSANIARRHLARDERRELLKRLARNGVSTRQAAKAAGVSPSTALRAAVEARASNDAPAAERVTGADGKSYPATRRPSPAYLKARQAHDEAVRNRTPEEQREIDEACEQLVRPVRQAVAEFASVGIVGHIEQATDELRELTADASLTAHVLQTIERAHVAFVTELQFAQRLLGRDESSAT